MGWLHVPRLTTNDLVAGASVAMVLIPQSLAYAELAELPPYIGLYAAAFPLLVFALLASSPYLQTGPVAVTSLLTISALPEVPPGQLPAIAALMAFMVGALRVAFGLARLGKLVRLMSSPVVMGFTSGAAVVIVCSQLPKALGMTPPESSVLREAAWAVVRVTEWSPAAVLLSVVTTVLFIGGRRLNPLFPGVLVAVVVGVGYSRVADYGGATVAEIPEGLPPISFDLPWDQIPTLLVGAIVIALIGFAEPAAIARTFANEAGQRWNPDQEMVASGVANFVSAFSGGYPVGGSFSRSSVNRLAGARTRLSGGVTGLIVLAFLPFAAVLEPLPTAVLGAIVLSAVSSLVRPRRLLGLWQRSRSQALLAWATAIAVLVFTPRIERAVLLGVGLTIVLHLGRRLVLRETVEEDTGTTVVEPVGMLWLGTESTFERKLVVLADRAEGDLVVDLASMPFVDDATIDAMASASRCLAERGRTLTWTNPPVGADRVLNALRTQGAGSP